MKRKNNNHISEQFQGIYKARWLDKNLHHTDFANRLNELFIRDNVKNKNGDIKKYDNKVVSSWYNGKSPDDENLKYIAEILECKPDYFTYTPESDIDIKNLFKESRKKNIDDLFLKYFIKTEFNEKYSNREMGVYDLDLIKQIQDLFFELVEVAYYKRIKQQEQEEELFYFECWSEQTGLSIPELKEIVKNINATSLLRAEQNKAIVQYMRDNGIRLERKPFEFTPSKPSNEMHYQNYLESALDEEELKKLYKENNRTMEYFYKKFDKEMKKSVQIANAKLIEEFEKKGGR